MIDEISFEILKILQQKARVPNVEVARKIGMAPSAVLERIRKLERMGFIDGYEVRLNPEQFGRRLVAFITVCVDPMTDMDKMGKTLSDIPEIQEVHYITGEDCYLLKIRVSDADALGRVLVDCIRSIKGVLSTRTSVALATYRETLKIPLDHIDPSGLKP